ncbi:MAG: hypothetical protein QGG39_08480 [Candidatus Poribacteria bacterium]|nr:hypothetical protein [Candidatus Poribacteria bacterium]
MTSRENGKSRFSESTNIKKVLAQVKTDFGQDYRWNTHGGVSNSGNTTDF